MYIERLTKEQLFDLTKKCLLIHKERNLNKTKQIKLFCLHLGKVLGKTEMTVCSDLGCKEDL